MIPSVSIRKQDGSTGVVKPGVDGILAIIAPSEKGNKNQAAGYTRRDLAYADFGNGKLVEHAAYDMAVARKGVLLISGNTSTPGAYGDIVLSDDPGTATVTAGTDQPFDDLDVLITFVTGVDPVGDAGATYTYSLDGGRTTSAPQALGVLSNLLIPNSGVSFDFGAGTIVDGQTISCKVTGPKMNATDVADALEALRVSRSAWEVVLIDGVDTVDTTLIGAIDLWLSGLEGTGKYRTAIVNARLREVDETEAEYKDVLTAAYASASSIRVAVGADGGDVASILHGYSLARVTALALAARAMAIDIATDAAYVADGPAQGFAISDAKGNPKYHDEALYPGLDDLRLVTLRTIDGREGSFITNPLLISTSGSDYVFLQHARVMNKSCELAFQVLTGILSKGVRKQKKAQPGGEVYILEEEAQSIEALVQASFSVLRGRVTDIAFTLSRTDDIGSNAGAQITGSIEIEALSYIKGVAVTSRFVRSITVGA